MKLSREARFVSSRHDELLRSDLLLKAKSGCLDSSVSMDSRKYQLNQVTVARRVGPHCSSEFGREGGAGHQVKYECKEPKQEAVLKRTMCVVALNVLNSTFARPLPSHAFE